VRKEERPTSTCQTSEGRLEEDWGMDFYLTQHVTGYDNFKVNLKRFNLVEEDGCECGDLETASHVMMDCAFF
jgi:hypothetical protein